MPAVGSPGIMAGRVGGLAGATVCQSAEWLVEGPGLVGFDLALLARATPLQAIGA